MSWTDGDIRRLESCLGRNLDYIRRRHGLPVHLVRYTSEQITEFRDWVRQNLFHGPTTIVIDEYGMHAESPGDPRHTHVREGR